VCVCGGVRFFTYISQVGALADRGLVGCSQKGREGGVRKDQRGAPGRAPIPGLKPSLPLPSGKEGENACVCPLHR
jgi:hypothetical protein